MNLHVVVVTLVGNILDAPLAGIGRVVLGKERPNFSILGSDGGTASL